MRDPYLYEDVPVLRNLLNIKDAAALEQAEADITYLRLYDVDGAIVEKAFDLSRLLAIHKYIFGDIFQWAGKPRVISVVKGEKVLGGDSIRYSPPGEIEQDCITVLEKLNRTPWASLGIHDTALIFSKLIASLWQCHPFREGNTRTVIVFATQFAEARGFRMDKSLLKDSAAFVRNALVKASDGQYSEHGYLVQIFEDAIRRG